MLPIDVYDYRRREFVHESKKKIETSSHFALFSESRTSYYCFFMENSCKSICLKHKSFYCFSKMTLKKTDMFLIYLRLFSKRNRLTATLNKFSAKRVVQYFQK